jgi:hypothetical protein
VKQGAASPAPSGVERSKSLNGQNRKDIKPGLRVHITQSQMLGQILTAAQARNTYSPIHLDIFMGFAHVAAAVYMAHGGPEWLRTLI